MSKVIALVQCIKKLLRRLMFVKGLIAYSGMQTARFSAPHAFLGIKNETEYYKLVLVYFDLQNVILLYVPIWVGRDVRGFVAM